MIGAALVVLSARLLPLRDYADLEVRYELAQAIERVTDDVIEQRLLMVTATEESAWDPKVLSCERKGDSGKSVTAFQVQVFGSLRREVCASPESAARVALEMLRASQAACAHLPEAERLAFYASGSCDRGRQISRRRWVASEESWP